MPSLSTDRAQRPLSGLSQVEGHLSMQGLSISRTPLENSIHQLRKFRTIKATKNVIVHFNALVYLSITKIHQLVKNAVFMYKQFSFSNPDDAG